MNYTMKKTDPVEEYGTTRSSPLLSLIPRCCITCYSGHFSNLCLLRLFSENRGKSSMLSISNLKCVKFLRLETGSKEA